MRIDPESGVPIYHQVADGLRELIASGALGEGAEAPSLRTLAAELRVNYHTVARAYHALEEEGTLVRQRGGAYVVAGAAAVVDRLLQRDVDALCRRAKALGVSEDALVQRVRAGLRERACG